jgi:hypothetical protein
MISQKHQELKEEYVLDIKKMFNAVKDEYKEDYIRFWNETAILEDNILSFTDFNNLEKWDIKTYFNKIEAISSLVTITYNKGCKHSSDYSTAINKRNISKISNIKYFLQDMDETIELYKDIERYFNQKIEKLKEELEELFGMNDFYRFRKLYKVDTELNLSFYPTKRSIKINNKIMDINLTEDIKLTIDTIIQGLKQSNIHKFNKLIDDMARIANSREYRHIIDLISYIEYQDIYNYIEILTGSQLSGVKEPQKLESFGALKHLTKFEIYKRIKELVDINFIKIDSFNDNENRCTLCSHNNYLEFVKAIKKNLPSNRITPDYKKKFEQK